MPIRKVKSETSLNLVSLAEDMQDSVLIPRGIAAQCYNSILEKSKLEEENVVIRQKIEELKEKVEELRQEKIILLQQNQEYEDRIQRLETKYNLVEKQLSKTDAEVEDLLRQLDTEKKTRIEVQNEKQELQNELHMLEQTTLSQTLPNPSYLDAVQHRDRPSQFLHNPSISSIDDLIEVDTPSHSGSIRNFFSASLLRDKPIVEIPKSSRVTELEAKLDSAKDSYNVLLAELEATKYAYGSLLEEREELWLLYDNLKRETLESMIKNKSTERLGDQPDQNNKTRGKSLADHLANEGYNSGSAIFVAEAKVDVSRPSMPINHPSQSTLSFEKLKAKTQSESTLLKHKRNPSPLVHAFSVLLSPELEINKNASKVSDNPEIECTPNVCDRRFIEIVMENCGLQLELI